MLSFVFACDRGSGDWSFFVDVINGRSLIQCPKRIIYDVSEWTEIQNNGSIENDVKAVKSYGELKGLKKHPWSEKRQPYIQTGQGVQEWTK